MSSGVTFKGYLYFKNTKKLPSPDYGSFNMLLSKVLFFKALDKSIGVGLLS